MASETKRPRHGELGSGDPCADTLLAMSRYCQERWVEDMVKMHVTRGERMKVALLSGDAGCGKSYALSLLYGKLSAMNVTAVGSAMTNKAAGCLRDTGVPDPVYTFHKLMGLKKDLLDEKLTIAEFERRYLREHRDTHREFVRAYRSPVSRCHAAERHRCPHPRPESCAVCSRAFEKLRARGGTMALAPPFLGVNVLFVDEYGLMTTTLLDRMLRILFLFYGPDNGPLIVFSGSVSQLQPPGAVSRRVWESERFEQLLGCSTPLLVNRRQFADPGYAEAASYLQFNTVTQETRRMFSARATVKEEELMDPSHEPDKVRIFHQDAQRNEYTAAYARARKGCRFGKTFLGVVEDANGGTGPRIPRRRALECAALAFPKIFSEPRPHRGTLGTERDYLRSEGFWPGCRVRMFWHMDRCGIRLAAGCGGNARDTDGIVQRVKFQRKGGWEVFYVKGSQSGNTYAVAPSAWRCANWTVTVHPLSNTLAMNTYECQGCTISGQVLYHPPRNFTMSPLKPSVYVVLTRVTRREDIAMTNCNFAEKVGFVNIYHEKLVAYRKRVEMNYTK